MRPGESMKNEHHDYIELVLLNKIMIAFIQNLICKPR